MNSPPPLDQFVNLVLAIRHARRAFIASGRPRGHWDAMANGVREDYRSGVDPRQIARVVRAWTRLLTRPSRGVTIDTARPSGGEITKHRRHAGGKGVTNEHRTTAIQN